MVRLSSVLVEKPSNWPCSMSCLLFGVQQQLSCTLCQVLLVGRNVRWLTYVRDVNTEKGTAA